MLLPGSSCSWCTRNCHAFVHRYVGNLHSDKLITCLSGFIREVGCSRIYSPSFIELPVPPQACHALCNDSARSHAALDARGQCDWRRTACTIARVPSLSTCTPGATLQRTLPRTYNPHSSAVGHICHSVVHKYHGNGYGSGRDMLAK
jgi:hypothetical protein